MKLFYYFWYSLEPGAKRWSFFTLAVIVLNIIIWSIFAGVNRLEIDTSGGGINTDVLKIDYTVVKNKYNVFLYRTKGSIAEGKARTIVLKNYRITGMMLVGSGKNKASISDNKGNYYYGSIGSKIDKYKVIVIEKSRVVLVDAKNYDLGKPSSLLKNDKINKYLIKK